MAVKTGVLCRGLTRGIEEVVKSRTVVNGSLWFLMYNGETEPDSSKKPVFIAQMRRGEKLRL